MAPGGGWAAVLADEDIRVLQPLPMPGWEDDDVGGGIGMMWGRGIGGRQWSRACLLPSEPIEDDCGDASSCAAARRPCPYWRHLIADPAHAPARSARRRRAVRAAQPLSKTPPAAPLEDAPLSIALSHLTVRYK